MPTVTHESVISWYTLRTMRNLDLLRASAVLFVFFDHLRSDILYPNPNRITLIGRVGVMIFFVHTSLVLMQSMERTYVPDRRFVWSFYIRRAFRIYPLSIFAVLVVLAAHIPLGPLQPYHFRGAGAIAANLLLIQNITRSWNLLGPMWSLPYEVQMYVFLPFLYLWARRGKWESLVLLYLGVALINAIGITIGAKPFRIIDFFPCFIPGIFAFIIMKRWKPIFPSWLWPVALAACTAVYCWFDSWQPNRVIYPNWILSLALGLLIPTFYDLPISPLTKLAALIAKYSYGIYLAHMPLLWFSFVVLRDVPVVVQWTSLITLSVAIPVGLYHAIEEPMIRVGKRLAGSLELKNAEGPELVGVR